MIESFRHRGLKALYQGRTSKGVAPEHEQKLRDILAQLDQSEKPSDMDLPGYDLHPLRGPLKGHYSVAVSGNWRVTFKFENGEESAVNYLDYH